MLKQSILVLDCGGASNQLIARLIRDENVFCELLPYNASIEKMRAVQPAGIILTGSENGLSIDKAVFDLNVPVLGIGTGALMIATAFGGKIKSGEKQYGKQGFKAGASALFKGTKESFECWMNHSDYIEALPKGFEAVGSTPGCAVAAIQNSEKKIFATQFFVESSRTKFNKEIVHNFLYDICGCTGEWTMKEYVKKVVADLKVKIGDKKVLCALSGGVDSAVTAAMIHKACPNLICVFVDTGLMRKNEASEVVRVFKDEQKMNLIKVDAEKRFLDKLAGVADPERKRKIIGEEFIRVFEEEAKKIGKVDFLAQGTIYPDIIESGIGSAVVKSHHNVGGLPSVVDFKEIVEPLRDLFKDEVRACGFELGLPASIVMRQPFPGPGLGVRVLGEVTKEKLDILRDADFIFREEIALAGLDTKIWQYFAVLPGIKSVGVSKDERTYNYTIALRAIHSVDGMTADWARIPYDVLEKVSSRIVKEVKGVNRIAYDITSKPPATIEWE